MADQKASFDSLGFFRALEATTQARDLKWKEVSSQTGVSASTLSRMAQGRGPDSASLAALAAWSGVNPADFVPTANRATEAEPLAAVSRLLRTDPRLTTEAAEALDQLIKSTYERLVQTKSK